MKAQPFQREAQELLGKVDDLLSDERRWVQGVPSRDVNGVAGDGDERLAACWCLTGAMDRFRMVTRDGARILAAVELRRAIDRGHGLADWPAAMPIGRTRASLQLWNDAQGRTFPEVKAVIASARVAMAEALA